MPNREVNDFTRQFDEMSVPDTRSSWLPPPWGRSEAAAGTARLRWTAGWRSVQVQRQGVLRSGQITAPQSLSNLADRLRKWPVGIWKALELA
jgi:hypothetical protein